MNVRFGDCAIGLTAAALLCGCGASTPNDGFAEVVAAVETAPVPSAGDAADDPAIWVNPRDPAESRILGTDKKSGLLVYDLQSRQIQYLARGRLNNVDVRQDVMLAGRSRDIAVATNRTEDSLDVFEIARDGAAGEGHVRWLAAQELTFEEPYGVCLFHENGGALHVFVNDKSGAYQQWRIDAAEGDAVALTLVREFAVSSKPEGCVADDTNGILYVGEEAKGVWKMPAAPAAGELEPNMELIAQVGDALTADVEGLAIYRAGDHPGYLLASSQGDDSYAVFALAEEHAHLGSFRVIANPASEVDGTEETDGIATTSMRLNAIFAQGLLVVQDGKNTDPSANQNFKLIPWENVKNALDLP